MKIPTIKGKLKFDDFGHTADDFSIISLPLYWKISTNEIYSGKHWSVRSSHKEQWNSAYSSTLKGIQQFPGAVKLKFRFMFKRNPLDCSNCSYMVKLLEDVMVKCGIFKNDSPKCVKCIQTSSEKGIEDMVTIGVYNVL